MRGFFATVVAIGALLVGAPAAVAQSTGAERSLSKALTRGLRAGGHHDGAEVVDLTTGQTLFTSAATTPRLPASVEKLYTTSTALLRFGPGARLTTQVLGVGQFVSPGDWQGVLYLKGGGDPTFGSKSYDHFAYGTGATMQRLASNLVRATGIKSFSGRIVGDESYFDSKRGTPPYGYHASSDIEGELSALIYDRGMANQQGSAFQKRPALFAARQFARALKAGGVAVPRRIPVYTGKTPSDAQQLAAVHSPRMATLIKLTNTPSDNFFAEMLLKGIGAQFGGAGTTAAGAAVVSSQMAGFGISPQLDDGSGLSRTDLTSPSQVVTLLGKMQSDTPFTNSLAIGGETGTLVDEMRGTVAQGNCIGKTGTLRDVANLAGYCTARDGHRLAFAFLMNDLSNPASGHDVEANMAVAVAKYNG